MEIDADERVEERRIRVRLAWGDVQQALRNVVGKKLGLSPREANQLAVWLEQETEGSPAYKVQRWKAEVKGAIDLRAIVAAPLPLPPHKGEDV